MFSNLEISWVMPRFPVKTVALYFRGSYINAADLKIFYEPTLEPSLESLDVWHGEEDIATFDVTTACLNENCQNCHVSNLFDDSIYSFYFSESDDECRGDPNKHLMTTFEVLYQDPSGNPRTFQSRLVLIRRFPDPSSLDKFLIAGGIEC